MPNGGSDCCGTCWFNRKNQGETGYKHADDPGPGYCDIRDVEIEDPFWTYCANHPRRSPEGDPIPIGPILVDRGQGRESWKHSPDTETIRLHLLELLGQIEEQPKQEYPIGIYRDEIVVWQLGEFREQRAVDGLERIISFDPDARTGEPFHRTRHSLVTAARDALSKIQGGGSGG